MQSESFSEGLCLPDVPEELIARYPRIAAGIAGLRAGGYAKLHRSRASA